MQRLNAEAEQARNKQAELNQKIKEADDELTKRKTEADQLAKKMITDAEEKVKVEREKLIHKAREEGEEIITKAQGTKDKIRKELEKEMYLKSIDYAVHILTAILNQDAKGVLTKSLFANFIEGLKKVDMSRIGPEVISAELIGANSIDEYKEQAGKVLQEKLNRVVTIKCAQDPQIIGGVILKFGSLALDGSLLNLIKEEATKHKQKTESE